MNSYDEDLKPGDLLIFTDEVEAHINNLGIEHSFEYGDTLIVLRDEPTLRLSICVSSPQNLGWQAWILRTVAENARDFWLRMRELEFDNEGISLPVPLEYWNKEFRQLTPADRVRMWQELREKSPGEIWTILVGNPPQLPAKK